MNEKSLEVLKQYDIEVGHICRGRGGMLLNTNEGTMLFLECMHPDRFYERENIITAAVAENGFARVDTYIKNKDEKIVTEDEEGRRYILKRWFDARECNVKDIGDLCAAMNTLGHLHMALERVSKDFRQGEKNDTKRNATATGAGSADAADAVKTGSADTTNAANTDKCYKEMQLVDTYTRHVKELKMASNYLKNKKKRSEFELHAYRNIGAFYEEAVAAAARFNSTIIKERLDEALRECELSHGSYSYHNVLFGNFGTAVTNFEKCCNECQITDLYQFMRKILEKYDWDIELAYKLIDEYDKVKTISDADIELLTALFSFPEKFWKVINYYFNMNKAWIPPKSIEKLKTVIEQNQKRKAFLETLL